MTPPSVHIDRWEDSIKAHGSVNGCALTYTGENLDHTAFVHALGGTLGEAASILDDYLQRLRRPDDTNSVIYYASIDEDGFSAGRKHALDETVIVSLPLGLGSLSRLESILYQLTPEVESALNSSKDAAQRLSGGVE